MCGGSGASPIEGEGVGIPALPPLVVSSAMLSGWMPECVRLVGYWRCGCVLAPTPFAAFDRLIQPKQQQVVAACVNVIGVHGSNRSVSCMCEGETRGCNL
jgi:hypothetical protein